MCNKHPSEGNLVRVISSPTRPEQVGLEGLVIAYVATDWQSKVEIQPKEGPSFWAWTWDVLVVPSANDSFHVTKEPT
jgi:hypothetical protein